MIALPDDFLLEYTARNIAWLKKHPEFLEQIFFTSTRETVSKIEKFMKTQTMHVTLGYPRDQTALPAFSIVMAPESEVPLGIGDELGTFDTFYQGTPLYPKDEEAGLSEDEQKVVDYAHDMLKEYLENTGMRATYRIECWADNADMVSYMYAILKWSTWACRRDMHRLHWTNITLSGMDLEPMTEYMPVFVYRRALQITMEYENVYYTNIEALSRYGDLIVNPGDHVNDPDVKDDLYEWRLRPHYYDERLSGWVLPGEGHEERQQHEKSKQKNG